MVLWQDYIDKIEDAPKLGRVIIITPTYNRAELLEEAIESVVKQTYKDWEYYIIDDRSSDETPKMIKENFSKDPRIHYLYMNRKTNPVQINELGCRIAMKRGEFWTRLASDDKFLPSKIETDVEFLNHNQDFGGCYGPFQKIDIHSRPFCEGSESVRIEPNEMLTKIKSEFIISWANICVRTSVLGRMLKRFGHFSADNLTNMEDWVFNLKMLLTTKVGWIGDNPTTQYRIHTGQATNDNFLTNGDFALTKKTVESLSGVKSEQSIANYLGVKDIEYTMHMSVEYGAERNIILGGTRNWQQSHKAQEMIPTDARLVLDLGCGRGYWTDRISTLLTNGKCIGIDAMKEFVEKGREEFKRDLRVMDYHRLEFPNNVFDVVYADNTLEHTSRYLNVLAEVYRVLKMNGIFVLLIPPDKLGFPEKNNPYHVWKVDKAEVTNALETSGFKILEFVEFDLVKEKALLYYESKNLMYIIKCKKV
jgi:glycosyltransferase involved in cell wall biosynthesis